MARVWPAVELEGVRVNQGDENDSAWKRGGVEFNGACQKVVAGEFGRDRWRQTNDLRVGRRI